MRARFFLSVVGLTGCDPELVPVLVPVDAGADVSPTVVTAPDAAADALPGDAGPEPTPEAGRPSLGSECAPATWCDSPGGLYCYQAHTAGTDMYGRCTWFCSSSSTTVDEGRRATCEAAGGECVIPQTYGPDQPLPIYMPR